MVETKIKETKDLMTVKPTCYDSTFGCCEDGYTSAKGPDGQGCPQTCDCHPAGSYNSICDSITGQCPCRPGVIGLLCDTCSVGYWGIKKILDSQNIGCLGKQFGHSRKRRKLVNK